MKTRFPWMVVVPLVIFTLLSTTLLITLRHGAPGNKFATHLNEPVPATRFPILQDSSTFFDTHEWIGRPYIVNFFASWCTPCRAEHDQLMALSAAHIPLIGIDLEDHPTALASFLDQSGNPFIAILDDAKGQTSIDWGLTGVPETFIIDAQGMIRFHFVGPLTESTVIEEILPLWKGLQP